MVANAYTSNAYYFPVFTVFATHEIPGRLRADGSYFPEAGHKLSVLCRCFPQYIDGTMPLLRLSHRRLFKEEES